MKSLNKILPLVLMLSISLIMVNQVEDVYAPGSSPITIVMEITSGPAFPITIHVENKDSATDPTDPCGDGTPTPPCETPVILSAAGDTFTVHPPSGESDLNNETHFFDGIAEFIFTNKDGDDALHTSCSKILIGETGTVGGYILTVLSQQGGSGDFCPDVVGGHGGPIDKTSLLVTGAQLNASWMIPLLISAIGIGLFVVTRKS